MSMDSKATVQQDGPISARPVSGVIIPLSTNSSVSLEKVGGKALNLTGSFTIKKCWPRSIMYETLARYHMDGKVGYRIAEYLIKKQ